jgi:hypothetical protein
MPSSAASTPHSRGATPLQCSAGFALTGPGDTVQALLDRSDGQMYTVQRARRGAG